MTEKKLWMQIIIISLITILISSLFFPIKVICGAPGNTCASPDGTYYYETEPLAVFLYELIFRKNERNLIYSDGRTE